jgi:hypothetical protein
MMPSSAVADFSHDPATNTLTVTFTTGRIYEYDEVPTDVFAAFQNAFSKGTFFNKRIRDRYRFREISPA